MESFYFFFPLNSFNRHLARHPGGDLTAVAPSHQDVRARFLSECNLVFWPRVMLSVSFPVATGLM